MLDFLIILAILAAVVFVVGGPLRAVAAARTSDSSDAEGARRNGHMPAGAGEAARPGGHAAPAGDPVGEEPSWSSEIAELQAARDAKYREIRDADLDHRTGKLSDADYEAVDRTLRAEAVEILRALDSATN